jgi:3-oxocholest-4-en-26-oyl-CoA dehydrogenase alpha subunit
MEQTLARDLAAWACETKRPDGTTVFDDPLTLERIGRIAVDEAILVALDLQMRWQAQTGELPQVEGAMRKLFWAESAQRHGLRRRQRDPQGDHRRTAPRPAP